MSYHDTIEEDLARANEILATGRMEFPSSYPADVRPTLVSGTIHGADVYTAYKLLESFVAEIEARGRIIELVERQLAKQDAEVRRLHTVEAAYVALRVESEHLRALVDAVGPKVCELALRHQRRDAEHQQEP